MILYIKGADFSNANIDSVTRKYSVSARGGGVSITPTSIQEGVEYKGTISISSSYIYNNITSVTVGETYITDYTISGSGNGMTITIPADKVTGNIVINVSTTAKTYTFTINPTPSDATVTLTAADYTQAGNSITVAAGTSVSWKVEATDYETQSGTETINSDLNKSVTLSQSTTGGENGIYPIGQVLDSGTVSITATSLVSTCTTKGILECGGSYEITITTSYSGDCSLYLGGSKGSQYILKKQTGVVANTPFTLTFNVPYLNYLDKEEFVLNKVWFRSHQSTECTFTYSIKKTGYDNNPLEGVATFKDATVSGQGQRVFGFEAGCTYDYEITPSYTGQMTIYQAYSNVGSSTGSVENIGAMSISSVTANTPITGTITILETPSVTEATLGRLPDTLILRSHQSVEVSIQYKFTKK